MVLNTDHIANNILLLIIEATFEIQKSPVNNGDVLE